MHRLILTLVSLSLCVSSALWALAPASPNFSSLGNNEVVTHLQANILSGFYLTPQYVSELTQIEFYDLRTKLISSGFLSAQGELEDKALSLKDHWHQELGNIIPENKQASVQKGIALILDQSRFYRSFKPDQEITTLDAFKQERRKLIGEIQKWTNEDKYLLVQKFLHLQWRQHSSNNKSMPIALFQKDLQKTKTQKEPNAFDPWQSLTTQPMNLLDHPWGILVSGLEDLRKAFDPLLNEATLTNYFWDFAFERILEQVSDYAFAKHTEEEQTRGIAILKDLWNHNLPFAFTEAWEHRLTKKFRNLVSHLSPQDQPSLAHLKQTVKTISWLLQRLYWKNPLLIGKRLHTYDPDETFTTSTQLRAVLTPLNNLVSQLQDLMGRLERLADNTQDNKEALTKFRTLLEELTSNPLDGQVAYDSDLKATLLATINEMIQTPTPGDFQTRNINNLKDFIEPWERVHTQSLNGIDFTHPVDKPRGTYFMPGSYCLPHEKWVGSRRDFPKLYQPVATQIITDSTVNTASFNSEKQTITIPQNLLAQKKNLSHIKIYKAKEMNSISTFYFKRHSHTLVIYLDQELCDNPEFRPLIAFIVQQALVAGQMVADQNFVFHEMVKGNKFYQAWIQSQSEFKALNDFDEATRSEMISKLSRWLATATESLSFTASKDSLNTDNLYNLYPLKEEDIATPHQQQLQQTQKLFESKITALETATKPEDIYNANLSLLQRAA